MRAGDVRDTWFGVRELPLGGCNAKSLELCQKLGHYQDLPYELQPTLFQNWEVCKRNVKDYGKKNICDCMVLVAKKNGLQLPNGEEAQTFDDVVDAWVTAKDPDPFGELSDKMFEVCYGWFGKRPDWNETMEMDFMRSKGWKYPLIRYRQ